jgi:hypothetical protein
MKIAGIIITIIGVMSTLGAIMAVSAGRSISFAGIGWIVLGSFLIYRANQKKEDNQKIKEWSENTD